MTLTGSATNDDIFSHGGLVGSAQETDFIGCSNEVDITGYQGQVGSIVGNTGIGGVTLTNCWNSGHVHLRGYKSTFEGVGGLVGSGSNTLTLTNCYNTGAVDFYYRTAAEKQYVGGLVGCFGDSYGTQTLTCTGCYSTGKISGDKPNELSWALLSEARRAARATKSKSLPRTPIISKARRRSPAWRAARKPSPPKRGSGASKLGESYVDSCPAPVLSGQTVVEHADANSDGKCDTCGKQLAEIAVPTRKADYPANTSDKAQIGKAYVLSDLQANKIFDPAEGQTLSYKNYYYERSADGGATLERKGGPSPRRSSAR